MAKEDEKMQPLLCSITESCRLLGVGRTKLYEVIASGELRIRKIGRKSLIAMSDLQRWAERLPAINSNGGQQKNEASR
jgi:excisionase family DNA binding protein